jgi:tRNA1Val (adenine37-N6)-methyltransferase
MSNDYFEFKQFRIEQSQCAMKVGTDGVLLGAWANVSKTSRILDVGTGTGLIALMLAQRAVYADIVAIDTSSESVAQAKVNVARSSWNDRIAVLNKSVQDYRDSNLFDVIVCNPPFFVDSLRCTDQSRNMARHTDTLSYRDLCSNAFRLLTEDGEFSVIIPSDSYDSFYSEAVISGFLESRRYAIRTVEWKTPRRYLIAFRKKPMLPVDMKDVCLSSAWHRNLLEPYLL